MTLAEIKELKIGQTFKYKGADAVVDWREYIYYLLRKGDENQKLSDLYFRHFSISFTAGGKVFTLSSGYPHPHELELPDYELSS